MTRHGHDGLVIESRSVLRRILDMRKRIGIMRIEKDLLHDIGGIERVILRKEDIGEMDRVGIAAIRRM